MTKTVFLVSSPGRGSVLVLVPPVSGDLGGFAQVDDVGLLGHGERPTLLVVTQTGVVFCRSVVSSDLWLLR